MIFKRKKAEPEKQLVRDTYDDSVKVTLSERITIRRYYSSGSRRAWIDLTIPEARQLVIDLQVKLAEYGRHST